MSIFPFRFWAKNSINLKTKKSKFKDGFFYTTRGDVTVILLALMVAAFIFASGFLNNEPPVSNGTKYIAIYPTTGQANNTLQLQSMQFISIAPTPTPTTMPTSLPPSISPQPTISINPSSTPPPLTGSPLCGTNLGLFDDHDTIFTSSTQNLVQQMHISSVRIPYRWDKDPGGARAIRALQILRSLGINSFVIVLTTPAKDPNAQTDDTNLINNIKTIMSGQRVYYEFGNEMDLNGYGTPDLYTNAWNQVIPSLKSLSPNDWFGGPVNFQWNPSYIAYFVKNSQVKPDYIDWHEYTCGPTDDPTTVCVGHIVNIGIKHIPQTKAAIQANGNQVPPIFITEWNYDASQGQNPDPRLVTLHQLQFAQKMLQEFKNDGVYAAYQYDLNTNQDLELINNSGNALTLQGQDFQSFCQNF